jgi:hypothetical protein
MIVDMGALAIDDDFEMVPIPLAAPQPKKPVFNKNLYSMPTERQHDYFVDDRQMFWRPYCDDLLKSVLQSPTKPKVLLAADLPRPALIHLLV